MLWRSFLLTLLMAWALLPTTSRTLARDANGATRPSFVFIYADDLGYGDLACHGHPSIKTPHIDRLAAEGTDFRSFTVAHPVCSPSRTAIMTGQFPSRWGVHQHFASHQQNVERGMPDWLDPQAPLLSCVLQEHGYRCGHFGKWHLSGGGIDGAALPTEYGFDDYAVWTGPGRHVFDGTDYAQLVRDAAAHDQVAASYISVAATDHAVEFIRASKDKPFYVNLWLHETHHLVSATDEDKAIYRDTPEPQRTYYAAVSRADRQVGRILDVLDELDLAGDTIIAFSSDNGPENSHPNPGQKFYYSVGSTGELRGRKRSLLLGGVGSPFVVRWPGHVPAGRVDRETPLSGVDVFPTFLAAAGVDGPKGYISDGENMLPALLGEGQTREKPLFWWWPGTHRDHAWPAWGMRDGKWMLLIDETGKRVELYNVVADRPQANNLASQESPRVAEMRVSIEEWKATLPTEIDPRLQSKETGRQSSSRKPGSPAAPIDRNAVFDRKDANGDGQLTLKEYLDRFPDQDEGKRRFPNFDQDGDGVLSREEFVKPNKKDR